MKHKILKTEQADVILFNLSWGMGMPYEIQDTQKGVGAPAAPRLDVSSRRCFGVFPWSFVLYFSCICYRFYTHFCDLFDTTLLVNIL